MSTLHTHESMPSSEATTPTLTLDSFLAAQIRIRLDLPAEQHETALAIEQTSAFAFCVLPLPST